LNSVLLNPRAKLRFGTVCYDDDFLQLDSSTEDKFSRHVIVDGLVFVDNLAAGRFVRDDIMSTLPEDLAAALGEYRDKGRDSPIVKHYY
jgi:hypothetical protein